MRPADAPPTPTTCGRSAAGRLPAAAPARPCTVSPWHQLAARCLLDSYPNAEKTLRRVLADEVARGTVDYHSTSRRYVLNGGLDAATREALLRLTDRPRSWIE